MTDKGITGRKQGWCNWYLQDLHSELSQNWRMLTQSIQRISNIIVELYLEPITIIKEAASFHSSKTNRE